MIFYGSHYHITVGNKKNLSPPDGPGEGAQRKGRDDDDNILKPFEALLKLLSALVDGFMKRLIFVDKAERERGRMGPAKAS